MLTWGWRSTSAPEWWGESFCSDWAPGKSCVDSHGAGPCPSLGLPQLLSMPWGLDPTQRHKDISEIQSNSSHKPRYLGNRDVMTMPHWRKGFAISAQHNHRYPIPIHEVVQSQDMKGFLAWMCMKGSFKGPAALRSTVPSYAYPMGL